MASYTDYKTFVAALNTVQNAGPIMEMLKALPDGVHESSAFLAFLQKNATTTAEGGDFVSWNIINDEIDAQSYYQGSTLNTARPEFLKKAILPKAYYSVPITYYKTDLINNRGKDAFVNYVAKQTDIAKMGMATRLILDVLGNGTTDANSGVAGGGTAVLRPIVGLQAFVETVPTTGNTYAGITRSSSTAYFNNQATSIASLAALSTSTLMAMMQKCTHMNKRPDVILMNDTAFRRVWDLAKAESWLKESKAAVEMGFPDSIDFKGCPIISEKFMTATSNGGYLTSDLNRIYFLNTKEGMEWRIEAGENMNVEPVVKPTNEHTYVQHITFAGQLCGINPRLNGVIYWT